MIRNLDREEGRAGVKQGPPVSRNFPEAAALRVSVDTRLPPAGDSPAGTASSGPTSAPGVPIPSAGGVDGFAARGIRRESVQRS